MLSAAAKEQDLDIRDHEIQQQPGEGQHQAHEDGGPHGELRNLPPILSQDLLRMWEGSDTGTFVSTMRECKLRTLRRLHNEESQRSWWDLS